MNEQQPGSADMRDFYPGKRQIVSVLGLSALLTTGVVSVVHETTPEATSEAAVHVSHACEQDGSIVPYGSEVAEGNPATVLITEDSTVLKCPEGSSLDADRVAVHTVFSDTAATIPNSTEILLGNTTEGKDPVLGVSVDEKVGTVTVTTDPVARIEKIDGVQR